MEVSNAETAKLWCVDGCHFRSNKFMQHSSTESVNDLRFPSLKHVCVRFVVRSHKTSDYEVLFGNISRRMESLTQMTFVKLYVIISLIF